MANNFTVEIFDGQPEAGGTLIASQTISLAASGSQIISTNWAIPAGIHDTVVVLDRTNQIAETNENNNRASVRVMSDMVDITLSATDLVFTPAHPVNGDSVILSITAHNTGIKNTGTFNLALYDGDPSAGGTLLQTFPISNIAGDGNTTLSYVFTAIPWTYRFYAIADTENVVAEMYEDNNTAIRSLKIKAPGEVLGPDLVPTASDHATTLFSSQTFTIFGKVKAAFENIGDEKIAKPFSVLIFEDKDNDGRYTQASDTVLGKGIYTIAKFDDDPSPEIVLVITQVYPQAVCMEGSVYLIEHDGKIEWGPVYLGDFDPEFRSISYDHVTVKAETDEAGEPTIGIHMNAKEAVLDSGGYLKPPKK